MEANELLSWLWLKHGVQTGALVFGQVLQKRWGDTREVCGTAGPWPGARGVAVPPVLEPGLGMQLQPRSCGLWRTWPYPGSVSTAHQQCCCRSVLLHGTRSLGSGKRALMQNWWPKVQGLDSFYRLTAQRHFWLNWERKTVIFIGGGKRSTDYPIWHSSMRVGWGLAGKSPRYPAGERLGQPQGWLLGAAARGPFGCGQL